MLCRVSRKHTRQTISLPCAKKKDTANYFFAMCKKKVHDKACLPCVLYFCRVYTGQITGHTAKSQIPVMIH